MRNVLLCKKIINYLSPRIMKIFKIFTAEIIFYIALALAAISYYVLNGIDSESQTDFLIALTMLIILCVITIDKIHDNIKSLKKEVIN